MKGFHRVLKLKMWNTYKNARKIADDIIVSMTVNNGLDDNKEYQDTYTSTIKRSVITSIGSICSIDTNNDNDDDYDLWTIRIYRCDGNQGSILSISQNVDLHDVITKTSNEYHELFTRRYMKLYELRSSLKFSIDRYNMSKKLSRSSEILKRRIECRGYIADIITCIDKLNRDFPVEMKSKEVEINEILKYAVDFMNQLDAEDNKIYETRNNNESV